MGINVSSCIPTKASESIGESITGSLKDYKTTGQFNSICESTPEAAKTGKIDGANDPPTPPTITPITSAPADPGQTSGVANTAKKNGANSHPPQPTATSTGPDLSHTGQTNNGDSDYIGILKNCQSTGSVDSICGSTSEAAYTDRTATAATKTSTQCSNATTISSLITEVSIADLTDFDDVWAVTPAKPDNDYLQHPTPTTLDTIHFDYELHDANFVHPNQPRTLNMNTFDHH